MILEGDHCQKVINILNNKQLHFDTYNWVQEVRWWIQKVEDIQFIWVGIKGNSVKDKCKTRDTRKNSCY